MTKVPSGTPGREHSPGMGAEEGQHGERRAVAGTGGKGGGGVQADLDPHPALWGGPFNPGSWAGTSGLRQPPRPLPSH